MPNRAVSGVRRDPLPEAGHGPPARLSDDGACACAERSVPDQLDVAPGVGGGHLDRGRPPPHKDALPIGGPCRQRQCGGMSRAAKGADCKSAGYAFVGSSPTSSTTAILDISGGSPKGCCRRLPMLASGLRGCSSMVEQQPSKLMTRVRFPSPAPLFAPSEKCRVEAEGEDGQPKKKWNTAQAD